ncbi:aromatic ring-hydroxylating dioxygenase subunit alpha, partial [Tritonibacter sp. SIMBA_163]
CYSLKGKLRAAPHVGGVGQNTHDDVKMDELGLITFRSHVWQDVIFVSIDGNVAPFEEGHADLIERWQEFDKPLYHGGIDSSF